MTAADGVLDQAGIDEIKARHYGEGLIPEHHHDHPCDACRLLLTLASATDEGPRNPSAEPYYLPMDCPRCGRRRMEWDGKVLRCEKCTASSEWDAFARPAVPEALDDE